MSTTPARAVARLAAGAAAGLATIGVVALSAAPAGAHVTVTPSTTAAGSYAVLTFSAGHGCEGSPTTEITIAMPEQVLQVTPTRNPLWTVEKVVDRLDEPATDAHGNRVTERVSEVVYTAQEPLPDGYRDTFELSLQLPDAPGETLVFPVVQTCERGETGWVETPADGQDAEELERPAPTVTITEASAEGGHSESATDAEEASASGGESGDTGATESAAEEEDGNGLAVAGLVAGLLGALLGGLALARTARRG